MKKFAKILLQLALAFCCMFALTACDEKDYVGTFRQEFHMTVTEVVIKKDRTVTYTVWETVNGKQLKKGSATDGSYDVDNNILTVIVEGVPLEAYLSKDKNTLTMYNPAYSKEIPVMILTRVVEAK